MANSFIFYGETSRGGTNTTLGTEPSAERVIYSVLSGAASIFNLCNTRIYPTIYPQNSDFPVIVYQKMSGGNIVTMDGGSDLFDAVFTLTGIAETYAEAKQLAATIKNVLHGYHGTIANTVVQGIFFQEESENDIPYVSENEQQDLFGVAAEYKVFFKANS